MEVKLIADLRGRINWLFCVGFGGVEEEEDLMWNLMRPLDLFFGSEDLVSELDRCERSEERMSDGSQCGAECEKTDRSLAFIVATAFLDYSYTKKTRS